MTAPTRTPRRTLSPALRRTAWRGLGIVLALGTLELLPRTGLLRPAARYPALHIVLGAIGDVVQNDHFWRYTIGTFESVALGVGSAFVVGVSLGLAAGTWPRFYRATITTFDFLRGIPPVALIPVLVLIIPVGLISQTLMAAYACQWILFFQVAHGRLGIDPTLWDTAKTLRLSGWRRFRTIIWPSVLPSVVTGARLAATASLALVITAGLVMGGPNLGNAITFVQSGDNVTQVYALIFLIGFIGLGLNSAVTALERRLLWWHASIRGEGTT